MASNIILTLCFLAAVLAVYYMTPQRLRWLILLAASLLFYGSTDIRMLFLVTASGLLSWLAGEKMQGAIEKRTKRGWLLGGILPLLGVLFLFKYLNFFVDSMQQLLCMLGLSAGGDGPVLKLIMPMGISYYTFKIISYLADIYTGKRQSEKHAGYFLTYVLFFPQILSGPIQRSESFLLQLEQGPVYRPELFSAGLQRILLGMFKKLVIANRLSTYVNLVYGAPGDYPGLAAFMAAVFYSLQIYCDFSGYSDIAIGMGELLGIESPQNFLLPYFSRNIREFWDRWHISLSGWLRDYIYIPLGGSRCSKSRRNLNVMITFLVSGLWHGADWTFIVWGGIHGLWNMLSASGKKTQEAAAGLREGLRAVRQTLVTFAGVTLAWVFFRADSLKAAVDFLTHMVREFSLSYESVLNSVLPFTGDNTCAAFLLTVCMAVLLLFIYEWQLRYGKKEKDRILSGAWMVIFGLAVIFFGVFGESGFLYANF